MILRFEIYSGKVYDLLRKLACARTAAAGALRFGDVVFRVQGLYILKDC